VDEKENCRYQFERENEIVRFHPNKTSHASEGTLTTGIYVGHLALQVVDVDTQKLIGAYHGDDQLKWILKNHLYNIRLDKDRAGAQKESELRAIDAKFLILYEAENEFNNNYTIYKINGKGGRKLNSTMKELKYPREPKGDYYCYDLDEEVNIGQYNLNTIISRARIDRRISEEGELLIMSCEELIKYKL
jgi:hypothetical protein